ncbi:type I glyceraldehyde-3-phosphate dehydrogenase [Paraconexibacter algicola]|uniref:Type I glyceraldehyde-3-phosphate dehydrogenase n=1 Tax=Paraconexibacter algicola TaxID=2133960 RepID=A0A2T4UN27_9ACTN|nr:type I glyceraldehyde-3-phosphate dehydrogenase [Paraconexibacter algicola]
MLRAVSATRIAINGLGRMGRLALRVLADRDDLEVVHVNELHGDAATSAHLVQFDSVHGRYAGEARADGDTLVLDGHRIPHTSAATPDAVAWDADIVLECTGRFRTIDTLTPYLDAGVGTVVVAAPVKDDRALNVVVGVNDDRYDPAVHRVVTAASCTTNCLAPVVAVLHAGLGIRHGSITTLHDLTNTQVIVDAPHKDLRRARSSSQSLIPTSTGSATAIGLILPELQGRLDGLAVRVPLLNASLTDAVLEVERATTVEEVNGLLAAAAAPGERLHGILGFEERPLVSVDYRTDPRSAIVDAGCTRVVGGTQVKVYAWYDNEWGYVNRMVELAGIVAAGSASR